MTGRLEFWFELGSNYSYLSMMRIEELARQYAVHIDWHPFLLGPIFKSFGWETSPFVLQKEKGNYMWHDIARQCRKHGLPWTRPTTFPRPTLLPMRVAIWAQSEPWLAAFCRRVMTMNFAEDRDVHTEEAIRPVLEELGLNASGVLDAAQSIQNKERLRNQTERARTLGIFGAPTFIVNGSMYWGNDRLEDAVLDAAGKTNGS